MEELNRKNFTLFAEQEIIVALFWNITSEDVEPSLENNQVLRESESAIEDFFRVKYSAVVSSELNMKLNTPSNLTSIKFCSFLYRANPPHRGIFKPSSPYYEAFNSKIFQYFEAGLFIKIVNNYVYSNLQPQNNLTRIEDIVSSDKEEHYFSYSLQHLSILFYIYLCCIVISFIALLGEIITNKIKNRGVIEI